MSASVFDARPCLLGEGPLWHPERQELFWFDIVGKRLLSRSATRSDEWQFDEHVSAAGWVDADTLLIASETGLWEFDIESGEREPVVALEADRPETRSNDGRADPQGGFWIGTMGKEGQDGLGGIHRYYKGELRTLITGIAISNAICFAPDGRTAYYTCTKTKVIMRVALDAEGWPTGDAEPHIDLTAEGLNPDGAVVDAEGYLWNAQWGAARVARYTPEGVFDRAIEVGGLHSSCPAFGGPDLNALFVTTAREGIADPAPTDGLVYVAEAGVTGQQEHQVIL